MSAVKERGVCPVRTRRILQMRTSSLFGAKTYQIFRNYGVSARTRVRTSTNKVGQFFAILCGRVLWTAFNAIKQKSVYQCFKHRCKTLYCNQQGGGGLTNSLDMKLSTIFLETHFFRTENLTFFRILNSFTQFCLHTDNL